MSLKLSEQATLMIGKQSYPVIALDGVETLSHPSEFKLTFVSKHQSLALQTTTLLCIIDAAGKARYIRGELNRILIKANGNTEVCLVPKLARLHQYQQGHIYLNETPQSIIATILKTHANYHQHQIIWHEEEREAPLDFVFQLPNESVYHFFQRQLQQAGWFYWLETNEHQESIHFAKQLAYAPVLNAAFHQQDVHGLGAAQSVCHLAQVFADRASQHEQRQQAALTGVSHELVLQAGMIATIGSEKHLVNSITHQARYPMPGDGSGDVRPYKNVWKALKTCHGYTPPQSSSPENAGLLMGVIEATSDLSSSLLDDLGRYRVRFFLDESEKKHTEASIPFNVLHGYGGASSIGRRGDQCVGSHCSLRDGAKVMIGFMRNDPNRPLIVAALPAKATSSLVTITNAQTNIIKTAAGHQWVMQDKATASGIYLATAETHNAMLMSDQVSQNDLRLQALSGDMLHLSHKDMSQETQANWQEKMKLKSQFYIHKTAKLTAQSGGIQQSSGQHYHVKSEKQQLRSKGQQTIQSGRHLQCYARDKLDIKTKGLHLSGQSQAIKLHGHVAAFDVKTEIHLSTGRAGIKLASDGEITVYGPLIGGASFEGKVNRHKTPRGLPAPPVFII